MNRQTIDRKKRIEQIKAAILSTKDIDYSMFEMEVSIQMGISLRLAKEYIKVARYETGNI